MKNRTKFRKFIDRNKTNFLEAGLLLALGGFIYSKISSEEMTEIRFGNGQNATYIESTRNPLISLMVRGQGELQPGLYVKTDSGFDYRDYNGIVRRVTDKGYYTLNKETGEYENFVPSEKDSVFYWKMKKYDDVIKQIMIEKEKNETGEERYNGGFIK